MNTLEEALRQIKQALLEGCDSEECLAEASADYRLNPDFLRRKFSESNKLDMVAWRDHQHRLKEAAKEMAVRSREVAVSIAKRIASEKWKVSGANAEIAGRIFSMRGKDYAYVVYGNDSPSYAIRAIDVVTHRIVNFPANKIEYIRKQIAPELSVAA